VNYHPRTLLTLLNYFEPLAHYCEQLARSGLVVEAKRFSEQYRAGTSVRLEEREKVRSRILRELKELERSADAE
jgi:hypothetical protein